MSRNVCILSLICLVSIFAPSCGHDQKLQSIAVQPASVNFLSPDARLNAQLTAMGTYIHPPETKDITNTVKWTSDITGVVTVTSTGVVSPAGTGECGIANVTARVFTSDNNPSGNVVTGSSTVTVHNTAVAICP